MRWRSGGEWKCPVVIRCPVGGYLKGGAVLSLAVGRHALHTHPGAARRLPFERARRQRAFAHAIRSDDPVLFLEHKHLYRQAYNKSQYPPDGFLAPSARRGRCARAT